MFKKATSIRLALGIAALILFLSVAINYALADYELTSELSDTYESSLSGGGAANPIQISPQQSVTNWIFHQFLNPVRLML